MIQITNSVKLVVVGLTFVVVAACLPEQVSAQQVEAYLRKADLNNDGRIEPHEMTGPITRYLKGKGYDTDERHKIKDIIKRASESKARQVEAASMTDLKVPKFGVEPKAKTNINTFGAQVDTVEYSEEVNKKTRELFEQYDRNGNGILDDWEISRMSWGSPRPSANDKNGDGRLSFEEIQGRYHDREIAKQRSDKASRDSDKSRGGDERSGGQGDRRGRYGRPDEGSRYGRDSRDDKESSSRDSVFASRSSSSSPEDEAEKRRERAEQYVVKYFESRDTDKNNVLEGDELKKVNSSSKSKYDKNRDGKITKAEVFDVVAPSTKTTATARSPSRSGSRSSSRSGTSSRTSSSFAKVDANQDRLVQMHEFSKTWTKKKLDEFRAKDDNGDGVITPEEW